MKYKVVCDGMPMQMSRTKDDKYYLSDAYLIFGNEAELFDSVMEATWAIYVSILYAMFHGYAESWGICYLEHSVIPVSEPESA